MNRKFASVSATALATLSAAPVLAHAGDHTHAGFVGTIVHFFTNPDHLLPLAAAAIVIAITLAKRAALKRMVSSITHRQSK